MTPRDGTAERRREVYRDALRVIARDYATDLQLDDVARSIACSRRQLQRVLAEIGQTSFRELLATARMHEARRLLAEPRVPVREVAERVGYQQAGQFSKSFRRQFGIAPRVYRRRVRQHRAALNGARRSAGDTLLASYTELGRAELDE